MGGIYVSGLCKQTGQAALWEEKLLYLRVFEINYSVGITLHFFLVARIPDLGICNVD